MSTTYSGRQNDRRPSIGVTSRCLREVGRYPQLSQRSCRIKVMQTSSQENSSTTCLRPKYMIPDRMINEFLQRCPYCQITNQFWLPIKAHRITCASCNPFELLHLDHIGLLTKDAHGNEHKDAHGTSHVLT
jgi:hypothetical protein